METWNTPGIQDVVTGGNLGKLCFTLPTVWGGGGRRNVSLSIKSETPIALNLRCNVTVKGGEEGKTDYNSWKNLKNLEYAPKTAEAL